MQRPSILWFSMEDTSPRFGCYGDALPCTPNLDRVAAQGCDYTQAFSVASVCAPSRAAVITGMYPTFIGAHHMRTTHQNRATPAMPTQLWMPYRFFHAAQQDIFREQLAGRPAPARAPEELFDLETDPHELHNLAGDARVAGELARLRRVLDDWRRDFDVYGDVPEAEMVRRWWPDSAQPRTATPIVVPISAAHDGQEPTAGGEFTGPLLVQLHTPTQGASIGWSTGHGWQVYRQPLRFTAGQQVILRVKAIRVGYAESDERVVELQVK